MKSWWGIANFFSLGNASCGILSVFQAFSHHFQTASFFILAAVIFDFLDGKTARYLDQATTFGKGLDSLSDAISFGVAPAVLGFCLLGGPPAWLEALLVLFVLAGVWRLAYYFQWPGPGRPPGMPITINGLAFPALLLFGVKPAVYPYVFALSIFLMVGPIFWKTSKVL